MKAVIMAGGSGTRLRPLTCNSPKPMAKLCGKPTILYILDLLKKHGFTEVTFTLHYLGEQIEQYFENESYKGIKLKFSYETEPLGTAGCVKKAAEGFTEDFLVISGDALTDIDLSKAIALHSAKKAKATIVTKHVDDPREFGLVLSSDGIVTGFSEKPSYLSCISDEINTGIYVLSPEVLQLIPKSGSYDFGRDVFPQMLSEGQCIAAYLDKGYWCDIGDLKSYINCQNDILNGLLNCTLSGEISENGIISGTKLPENVYVTAPCYIGTNVTIGENSIIEAGCVLCDNVSIGKNCHIHESILLEGAYLSDEVTCNEAIICENVRLKQKSSVFEGAVIGEDSIIGENCIISSGVKIWNNKEIPNGKIVHSDVKYGTKQIVEITENGISGETNVDITPEFLVRLGCSLSEFIVNNAVIACDTDKTSTSFKNALLSGITASGKSAVDCGETTLPMLIYLSRLINGEIIVHISANMRTNIIILNKSGLTLTRMQERRLESCLNRNEYKSASFDEFGEVSRMFKSELLYFSMLERLANFNSRYKIKLDCQSEQLSKLIEPVFDKVGCGNGEPLTVHLSSHGIVAEFEEGNGCKTDYNKLLMIISADMLKNGTDISLPYDFPAAVDFIAESYGRTVYRYYHCSNSNSDKIAREMAATEPYLYDGVILSLYVLGILSRNKQSLSEAVKVLPVFACENRFVKINCPPAKILNKLLSDNHGIGEGVVISENTNRILLRSNKKGSGIFLFAESLSSETAKELCDNVELMLTNAMKIV